MTKRKESEEPILVYVKVHPVLRDFIVATRGTDLIIPDDKGPLWATVKTFLRHIPNDYKPHPAGPVKDHVRIALPPISASSPIFNVQAGDTIVCNFLYRNFLDHRGQTAVSDQLMKEFKGTYRSFMAGYLASHPNQRGESQIKEGIDEFCRIHCIHMDDKITYEMLRKDWYRFRTRESSSDYRDEVKENI